MPIRLPSGRRSRRRSQTTERGQPVHNEGMERPSPGGITWTIAGERLALLAWPRAILLQLAHPLVAAGVAEHSGFRSSPFAPFARLHATVGAMRRLTFGSDEEAAAVVRRILGVHDRVNGTLHEGDRKSG